jgi:hypothetical protein
MHGNQAQEAQVMNTTEFFNRNLRYCMEYRGLGSSELAFLLDDYMLFWRKPWSKNLLSSQRKMRRVISRATEPKLSDMEPIAFILRVPTPLLVFGTIEELEAALGGEE